MKGLYSQTGYGPFLCLHWGTSQGYSLTFAQGQIGLEPFGATFIIEIVTVCNN